MSSAAIQKAPPAAQVLAAVTTAQIFPNLATPTLAAILNIAGTGRLEQKKFKVRGSGYATTAGATTTVTATLYAKNAAPAASLVAGNWSVIGVSSARVVNTTTVPWWIEADLIFDSVGGKLGGTFNAMVNNTLDAAAAITNPLTGLNGSSYAVTQGATKVPAAEPVFVVAVGLTFGVNASAGNIGNLQELILDA